eukprot:364504-Prymnesium_polylepis.2
MAWQISQNNPNSTQALVAFIPQLQLFGHWSAPSKGSRLGHTFVYPCAISETADLAKPGDRGAKNKTGSDLCQSRPGRPELSLGLSVQGERPQWCSPHFYQLDARSHRRPLAARRAPRRT